MSLGNRQAEVLQRIHRGGLCVGEDVCNLAGAIGGLGGGFVHLGGDCGEARHVGEVTHVVVSGLEFLHDVLTTEEGGPLGRSLSVFSGSSRHEALGNQIRNLGVEPIQELHCFLRVLGVLQHGHGGTTVRAGLASVAEPVTELSDLPFAGAGAVSDL